MRSWLSLSGAPLSTAAAIGQTSPHCIATLAGSGAIVLNGEGRSSDARTIILHVGNWRLKIDEDDKISIELVDGEIAIAGVLGEANVFFASRRTRLDMDPELGPLVLGLSD